MSEKIFFIACTHGNELIGKKAIESIQQKSADKHTFDWMIGNPRALALNVRYTDEDLNRVAPGKKDGSSYEQRRAYHLIRKLKKLPLVIDLHETRANDRIVLILPRLSKQIIRVVSLLPINEILYWPSSDPNAKIGPLTKFLPCGIEIESGTKNSFEKTQCRLERILQKIIAEKNLLAAATSKKLIELPKSKKFYYVYGRIQPGETNAKKLRDFQPVTTKSESFIPLLFGRHAGIIGYKMKRVNHDWIRDQVK